MSLYVLEAQVQFRMDFHLEYQYILYIFLQFLLSLDISQAWEGEKTESSNYSKKWGKEEEGKENFKWRNVKKSGRPISTK